MPTLAALANYLNPDKKKLAAKGITSVRSRVTNLTELLPGITHEQICEAITEAFFRPLWRARGSGNHLPRTKRQTCQTSPKPLPARVAGNGTSVRLRHSRICWMNALPGAAWNCISTLKKGHITRAQVFTDSLNPRAAGSPRRATARLSVPRGYAATGVRSAAG